MTVYFYVRRIWKWYNILIIICRELLQLIMINSFYTKINNTTQMSNYVLQVCFWISCGIIIIPCIFYRIENRMVFFCYWGVNFCACLSAIRVSSGCVCYSIKLNVNSTIFLLLDVTTHPKHVQVKSSTLHDLSRRKKVSYFWIMCVYIAEARRVCYYVC